jgi:hypothetical protein
MTNHLYGLDSFPKRVIILFFTTFISAVGFTQPGFFGICSQETKRPEREGDHSTQFITEIKNTWRSISSHPIRRLGVVRGHRVMLLPVLEGSEIAGLK